MIIDYPRVVTQVNSAVGQIIDTYTGCPIKWYPLLISIPDFPDGPMKKGNSAILTRLV